MAGKASRLSILIPLSQIFIVSLTALPPLFPMIGFKVGELDFTQSYSPYTIFSPLEVSGVHQTRGT